MKLEVGFKQLQKGVFPLKDFVLWYVFSEPNAPKATPRGQPPHRFARVVREEVEAVGQGVGAER